MSPTHGPFPWPFEPSGRQVVPSKYATTSAIGWPLAFCHDPAANRSDPDDVIALM